MLATQKKRVILRLLAVGGPVLLTLVLFLMTVSHFWFSGERERVSVNTGDIIEGNETASVDATLSAIEISNPTATAPRFNPGGPKFYQPEQQGPLLAPPGEFVGSSRASNSTESYGRNLSPNQGVSRGDKRVVAQPVSTNGRNFVGTQTQQKRQPLSDALEAMVDEESIDPLGDDLFLNTTSLEKLNQQLIPEVRAGFNLGKSGAIYAAREQFIYVLRRVAVAKDAKEHSDRNMKALAQGLRALDEADDFTPHGDSIEAELDTMAIGSSHATPVLHRPVSHSSVSQSGPAVYDEITPEMLTPHQASAEYARYAAKQLSEAMAEEEAGSMALYGLGKTFARLEAQSKDTTAGLKCNVMYRAAALAHPENYLAANELGVRLAKAGRYESARKILQLAASQPANATVFENLAAVEFKLGNVTQAEQIQRTGHQIAMRERMQSEISRRHGVSWVSPNEFRSTGPSQRTMGQASNQNTVQPNSQTPANPNLTNPSPRSQQAGQQVSQPANQVASGNRESPQGGWKTAFNYVKNATGWDKEGSNAKTEPTPNYNRADTQLARRPAPMSPAQQQLAQQQPAQQLVQQQGTYPQYR